MHLASYPDLPSLPPSLWRQQPCAGVALWWAQTETAESKQHISQSGVPERGPGVPMPGGSQRQGSACTSTLLRHCWSSPLLCCDQCTQPDGTKPTSTQEGHQGSKTAPWVLREHERAQCDPLREHSSSLSCLTPSSLHHIALVFERRG